MIILSNYGKDWVVYMMRHPYTIDVTSVEKRMRVAADQLINDMVVDQKMDQIKKMVAIKYVHKMRQKLLLLASRNGVNYEVKAEFKYKLAMANLKLHFKYVEDKMHGYTGINWK